MATPELRLRPYQQAAVEAVKQSWRAFDRTLVCMATGLGKTKLAVELANQWTAGLASEYGRPARVLWLAHRDELIQQAAAELELATGAPPGIEKADRTTAGVKLLDRIVVASIQTLYRESRLESVNPKTIGMVVGDEIHHAPAKSWEKVLDGFPGTKLVGLTATCDRTDEIALGKVLQDCAYDYRLMDAVTDGWACPIRQEYIEVDLDFSSVGISNGDLSAEAIGRIIEEESPLHTIAAATSRLSGDRQTMVFCPTVAVTRALAAVLSRYATKAGQRGAVAAWGAMPEEARGQVVQAYLSGEAQFLLNCMLFTEGFDAPQTAHVVIARPTRSRMLFEQMLGRGSRGGPLCPIPGKTDLLVTDLVGAGFRCKLVHAGDVLGGKYDAVVVDTVNRWAKEAADENRPADVAALVRKAILDADELRRRQRMEIIAEARLKRKEVDPFAALDVRNEVTAGWWQGMPPSAAQIAALEGEGIKTKGLNREECSRLIEEMRKRREAGLCSYRQLRRLSGYGYGPQTTMAEAAEVFENLRKRGWKHTRQEIVNWRRWKKTAGRQVAKPWVPPKSGPPEGWF